MKTRNSTFIIIAIFVVQAAVALHAGTSIDLVNRYAPGVNIG